MIFLKSPLRSPWLWALSLVSIWIFLHIGFLTGKYSVAQESLPPYFYSLFHFDNLLEGVFPLWDPFHNWGWINNLDAQWIGLLNPVYLVVGALRLLGAPAFVCFVVFLFVYFLITLLGFYLLCRQFTDNDEVALFGFAALLFSSLGVTLFFQFWSILLVAPLIWFFYFLRVFARSVVDKSRRMAIGGMTFTAMIMAVSYIPFFFATVLLCVLAGFLLSDISGLTGLLQKFWTFLSLNRRLGVFCLCAILLSCVPLIRLYIFSKNEAVAIDIVRGTKDSAILVPLETISRSGLWSETSLDENFSDMDFGMQRFNLLSFFVYFLLSLLAPFAVKSWWRGIFVSAFIVVLFFSTGVFGMHGWLYRHISFLGYFRNYFIFWPGVLAFAVFLAVTKFRDIVHLPDSRRGLFLVWTLVVSAAWCVFLSRLTNVPVTIYISMALTAGAVGLGLFRIISWSSRLMLTLLLVAIILPPAVVLAQSKNYFYSQEALLPVEKRKPEFAYLRISPDQDVEGRESHSIVKRRMDDSGFPLTQKGYMGSSYAHLLQMKLPQAQLEDYVHFKFVIYSSARREHCEAPGCPPSLHGEDWALAARVLAGQEPYALVYDKKMERAAERIAPPRKVDGPQADFRVTRFQANEVEVATDFSGDKFVVYNDNFFPGWRVFIDGKQSSLTRANVAFKGVWVPAGRHTVLFRFGSFGDLFFHWFLFFVFSGGGIWTFYAVRKMERLSREA